MHRAASYFIGYSYNFCWPVRTLRVREPDGPWQARTPAMAAGLSDHVWSTRGMDHLPRETLLANFRHHQISAISNTGKVRFMTYARTMNAALFLVFLSKLLRSTTGKLFLIVDRLQAHQTPAVKEWVAAHRDRIEVFPLPRRAPERNPDEYLNNDLKGQVNAQGLPDSEQELRSRIQGFMRKLLHFPEHVRKVPRINPRAIPSQFPGSDSVCDSQEP